MTHARHFARIATLCAFAAGFLTSCDKARKLLSEVTEKANKAGSTDSQWVSEIGAGDFDVFRLQNDKVVIVDFHAPWCGPCRQLAPMLEQIVAGYNGAVVVGKINVDDHSDFAAREGVRGIPDVRIYRNGGMVDKLVGLPPASELKQRIATQVEAQRASAAASGGGDGADGGATGKEPAIRPMTEDWLPPGIQRR